MSQNISSHPQSSKTFRNSAHLTIWKLYNEDLKHFSMAWTSSQKVCYSRQYIPKLYLMDKGHGSDHELFHHWYNDEEIGIVWWLATRARSECVTIPGRECEVCTVQQSTRPEQQFIDCHNITVVPYRSKTQVQILRRDRKWIILLITKFIHILSSSVTTNISEKCVYLH